MQKPEIVQSFVTKNRKDVVLAAFFCFAYLKVRDTEYKVLFDRFGFSTHKLCKKKRDIDINAEQSSRFHTSAQVKIVLGTNIFGFLFLRLKGSHI